MNVNLTVSADKICIPLFNTLSGIDNTKLFYSEHNVRPPLGIFNVSSTKFISCLDKLVAKLEVKDNPIELKTLHRDLVESFIASIEDTFTIFLCFYQRCELDSKKKFFYQQLKQPIPDIIDRYNKNIKPFRELHSAINNSIKHKHANYNTLEMSSIYGTCIGFYIDTFENEVITPNSEIHPPYNGMATAISYHYDVKRIIFYWLKVMEFADYEIRQIINRKCLICSSSRQDNGMELILLLNRIAKLKEYYFEDEYSKGVAKYVINSSSVQIEYPASKAYTSKLFRPSRYKMKLTSNGDGTSASWKLPYM